MIEIGPEGLTLAAAGGRPEARLRIGFLRLSADSDRPACLLSRDQGVVLRLAPEDRIALELGSDQPWAVLIGSGRIDLITGQVWSESLSGPGGGSSRTGRPVESAPQNYLVVPGQHRLDEVRGPDRRPRPIGASLGRLELLAYPLDPGIAARRGMVDRSRRPTGSPTPSAGPSSRSPLERSRRALAPIVPDPYGLHAWDQSHPVRCTIQLENSPAR